MIKKPSKIKIIEDGNQHEPYRRFKEKDGQAADEVELGDISQTS